MAEKKEPRMKAIPEAEIFKEKIIDIEKMKAERMESKKLLMAYNPFAPVESVEAAEIDHILLPKYHNHAASCLSIILQKILNKVQVEVSEPGGYSGVLESNVEWAYVIVHICNKTGYDLRNFVIEISAKNNFSIEYDAIENNKLFLNIFRKNQPYNFRVSFMPKQAGTLEFESQVSGEVVPEGTSKKRSEILITVF